MTQPIADGQPRDASSPIEGAWASAPVRGPLLVVLGVLCVAYLPVFLGQIVFFRDPAHWNFPARWFVRDALWRGDSPLWNPQQGLGFAVLANPLYGLFYPPNWLFLVTPVGFVASMLTWQSFAHVLWGSAGIVILARQLRLSPAGACVAGLAWGLSGYTTACWTTGLLLFSGAWLPWCGVGFVSLAARTRAGRIGDAAWSAAVVGAALPVAMAILLGEVFAALMGVGFGLALAVTIAALEGGDDRAAWARLASAAAAALVLAAGVGAVVVLPARAIAGATLRAQPLARVVAETCSLHPLRLIEFVAPGSMGYAYGDYPAAPWVGEKLLDGFPLMYSVYMGASVVALALLAFGRGRRLGAIVGLLATFVLLVGLGRHTPVHNLVRTVVRPLSYMRYPEKYLVVFVGFVAILAGLGAGRALGRGLPLAWRRTAIFLGVLAALAAIAPTAFPSAWAPFVVWGAIKGALAVALVLAVQILVRRGGVTPPSARVTTLLLVTGVAADLAIAAWPHLGFSPRQIATNVPRAATAILSDHHARASDLAPPRIYRAEKTEATIRRLVPADSHAEGELRSISTLIPNAVTTFGIATLPGYDAAIPMTLPKLWSSGQKQGQAVLRLLGIGYTILPIEDPTDRIEHRTGLEPMFDPLPGARLYRVPRPLPRVFLAGRVEMADDDRALARLLEPEIIEGNLALVASAPDFVVDQMTQAGRAGDCTLVAFSNTRVQARCSARRAGLAVFLEQHDVGWTALVDGAPAPLLRANLLMRAVPVSAGTHTIVLSYTPPRLRVGASISGLSLLVLVLLGATAVIRRRPRMVAS